MRTVRALVVIALASCGMAHGQAQYPVKPITMVVPFPPGSTTDTTARAVGKKLSDALRQPVIVENRPGANAAIGTVHVARSKPDGYTLLVGAAAGMTTAPAVTKALPYDVLRDFAPVSLIGVVAPMMVVRKDSPASTFKEFIEFAKKSPRRLTYGTASSTSLLTGEILKAETGIDMIAVPYKGPSQVAVDLIGGDIDLSLEAPAAVMPHIRSGELKVLAITNARRLPTLPEIPTMLELGFPGLVVEGFIAIFAPAGTPASVLERLSTEIAKAVDDPQIRSSLANFGMDARASSPSELRAMIARDIARFSAIVESAGIPKQ